jgi:hypothetical protein
MVTGVKNSSTAAHAGRKSRLKWIPDAWEYRWAILPRGLKIRWGTGRQVDNLSPYKAVRNPELWPRNSQTEWNRPRQWKRISDMRIASWNVRTLYTVGTMNELVKQIDKYKIDICALQEIGCPGKGTVIKNSYAPHNDVSVNDGPHIRRWSHNITILYYIIPLCYNCLQYSVQ